MTIRHEQHGDLADLLEPDLKEAHGGLRDVNVLSAVHLAFPEVQRVADFAELAKLNSDDGSAPRGGDLGWIYPGDTVPEFERAVRELKVGEVSEPVKSPFGWHLIQVLELRVADMSDDRKRLEARRALRDKKSDEAYQEWLRQLRDRAYVEYRLEER